MLKVSITKLGKKIQRGSSVMSTPCKFFIDEKEKMNIEVLMLRSGIDKRFYSFEPVIESAEIKSANAKAEKEAKESGKKLVESAKAALSEKAPEEVQAGGQTEAPKVKVVEEKKENNRPSNSNKDKKYSSK